MIEIRDLQLVLPSFSLGPLNLRVEPSSFFALMGPTGSGKTLLLEMIAGLVAPGSGAISVNGKNITRLPPEKRRMGLVYQDHALFPHLSVFDNIVYGQRYHRIGNGDGERYAHELMEMLDISSLAHRIPANLSGGEKQRTALARALADAGRSHQRAAVV